MRVTTSTDLRQLAHRVLPWLLAVNLAMLLFFLAFDYQVIFHSDAAVRNQLAQEIAETGQYFPRDWNYANGDLWVFFTHTFVLLFLPFLPNGIGLHVLSDILCALLILAGAWTFTGLLGVSRLARLAGLAVLTGGISVLMAEHVFGQAAYGSMFYCGAFLLYCYWQQLHGAGRGYWLWALGTALLAIVLFWANPLRGAIFYAVPLLCAAAALKLAAPARGDTRRHWRTALLFLAACAVGALLNAAVLRSVHNHPAPPLLWLDYDGVLNNIKLTVQGLLILFDGMPRWDSAVASPMGAYRVLRLLGALALAWLLPRAVLRLLGPDHPGRLFCATFAVTAAGLNLLVLLTTTLIDGASPDGAVRYLVPSLVCLLLLFTAAAVDGLHLRRPERVAGLLVVTLLATSSLVSYTFPYRLFFKVPPALKLPTQSARLTTFLRDNGLRYGYATFWNAGKLTVLADHQVRIRAVNFEQGLPMPMRKLSSDRWYTREYYQGPAFLLLQDSEQQQADLAALAQRLGAPSRVLRFEDWQVIVYPRNLAMLPEWDPLVRLPLAYPVSATTPHQIGRLAEGGLLAGPGEAGTLYFGPFRALAPGTYTATFDIDTRGTATAGFGSLDVTADGGKHVLARQSLTGTGRQRISLTFSAAKALQAVEFRVFASGQGTVVMRGVELVRARAPVPAPAPAAQRSQPPVARASAGPQEPA
ncbi:4-amino-4-deoxy-L-arabinose transferase-like glycosyltransferase [Pseudoduganella lurida]|uniref:4-amino-4-deoxy-L-arabinose transferase-like glycosyltransferase n=1 Tax=Pseudoduganella lurida TaxID=1036180 RepID=A0A562R5I1_9BURK|nr:hypothetical protein [Pseudoduganella lurida]TWI64325.1 4-amino-4-deoxy-L-arabinose transferase-like glycosyltransferase [Pseudoduganella lurida]